MAQMKDKVEAAQALETAKDEFSMLRDEKKLAEEALLGLRSEMDTNLNVIKAAEAARDQRDVELKKEIEGSIAAAVAAQQGQM
ncbi:unnamed protein product [Sphagnum balticum]